MFAKFFSTLVDPLAFNNTQRPPEDVKSFFIFYLWPLRKLLTITLLLAGIATLTEVVLYVYLGNLLDWMTHTEPSVFFEKYGTSLVIMFVIAAFVRPISLLLSRGLINFAITVGLGNTIRWHNHRYVVRQSLSYFQNDFAGRIAQKVMQTGHATREAVLNVTDGLWLLIIYLVGIAWLFTDMDSRLLIPIIIWIVGYALVISTLVPPVRKKSATLSEANSSLLGQVVDSYSNIQSVKLFAKSHDEDSYTAHFIKRHTQAFYNLMTSIFNMTIALTLLNTVLVVGTAAMSIYLWSKGDVSLGAIAVANALIMRVNQMSGWILRTVTSLFENIGTIQNGISTISQPNSIVDQPNAKPLDFKGGAIHFDNINFHYHEEEQADQNQHKNAAHNRDTIKAVDQQKKVLKDFNLQIKPGEKIGLVGRSGSGKSTLVNLLLRFFEVESGTISIDGTSIKHISQESLRAHIAMVTQDTALLHRSVRDNIRYGNPNATDEDVLNAAKRAEVDSFIDQLIDPKGNRGYDALVGERGVKLSGGQRQRIAIARVILKNAPILILDEATSALDSEVEHMIQTQLNQLMQDKTVIAIAHRLSTIASMDRLIVLDQGKIIEQGTHQALLDNKGLYSQLWQHQSGGFLMGPAK